jgi:prepilin-type N-terminal cleavage/methylation domain-containing protein
MSRRRRDGFTLVEMLVVIVIIAILTGLVTIGIGSAMASSRASATEAMLTQLSGACMQYAQRWGDFPPSTIDDLAGRAPNDTNNGIEALVACLSSEKRGGILFRPQGEEQYANVDGDDAGKNLTGWYFGDNKLREVTDFFQNVVTYLNHRDFAKPRPGVLKYRISAGAETVTIAPEKSAATNTWVNAGRFQIRSAGRDGRFGTSDDLRAGN